MEEPLSLFNLLKLKIWINNLYKYSKNCNLCKYSYTYIESNENLYMHCSYHYVYYKKERNP